MSKSQLTIGAKVKYFPLKFDKNTFTEHEVTSECWEVCGEKVVKVSGKRGGVSVDHLELI